MIEQCQKDAIFSGVIVNVSSVNVTEASVNRGDYCVSKAGLAMATQLWAARWPNMGFACMRCGRASRGLEHRRGRRGKVRSIGAADGRTPLGYLLKMLGLPRLARGELTYEATGKYGPMAA